jgi:dihydropteroate synthase
VSTAPPAGPWARVLRIVGNREALRILESLGVTERAAHVLRRSVLHRVVHLGPLPNEAARSLRREMTRLGGEAALPEPAWAPDGTTDVLLAGTLHHFDDLTRSLSVGEPEMRRIGGAIEHALDRDASVPRLLRLRHGVVTLDRTFVMGVLNVTPDSFSDGGEFLETKTALDHALEMEADGADFIDVGGVSSRPGAPDVPLDEELRRVMPVLECLSRRVKVPISIDTRRAEVARRAIDAGVSIVNDISGLEADPEMAGVVAEAGAGCILMHMRGTPITMGQLTDYADLVSDVYRYLAERVAWARAQGMAGDHLLVDPGIGFAKTQEQSLILLQRLGEFRSIGLPLVVGTSRKSFIGAVLDRPVDERAFGTMATVAWSVFQGARVVRVHEVASAVEVARMADALLAAST